MFIPESGKGYDFYTRTRSNNKPGCFTTDGIRISPNYYDPSKHKNTEEKDQQKMDRNNAPTAKTPPWLKK